MGGASISPGSRDHLGLLLCRSFGLGGLLLVAVDHHNADKGAHHGGTQQGQNNGDADGPNTRREEIVERVAGVNEGLDSKLDIRVASTAHSQDTYHQQGPRSIVQKDRGRGQQHGGTDELAQLESS